MRGIDPISGGKGPVKFAFPVKVKVTRLLSFCISSGKIPTIDASLNVKPMIQLITVLSFNRCCKQVSPRHFLSTFVLQGKKSRPGEENHPAKFTLVFGVLSFHAPQRLCNASSSLEAKLETVWDRAAGRRAAT